MSHPANRRQFIQTTAGASFASWVGAAGTASSGTPERGWVRGDSGCTAVSPRNSGSIPALPHGGPAHGGRSTSNTIRLGICRGSPSDSTRTSSVTDCWRRMSMVPRSSPRTCTVIRYFPSTHGRMHPNLSFDLLGAQVAALQEAEDLGPGLLHADLESRTCRSASRMVGRPPARRQVSSQARGDLRRAEGVHEYR